MGGPLSTPTPSLTLHRFRDVSKLEEPCSARKELTTKVGEQAKGEHINAEVIHRSGQLFDLFCGVELRFVAYEVVERFPAVAYDLVEVDVRFNNDRLGRGT